jgi:hypothetical protein
VLFGASVLGVSFASASSTAALQATPVAQGTPAAESPDSGGCPSNALAEQWPSEVREAGTSRLAYQRTEVGGQTFISSTICRDPGVDVPSQLYAAGIIIVVQSGQLEVRVESGIARINLGGEIILASLNETFTLLPGDSLIFDTGVQASFPSVPERTILNVLAITVSSIPTGCTQRCWIP